MWRVSKIVGKNGKTYYGADVDAADASEKFSAAAITAAKLNQAKNEKIDEMRESMAVVVTQGIDVTLSGVTYKCECEKENIQSFETTLVNFENPASSHTATDFKDRDGDVTSDMTKATYQSLLQKIHEYVSKMKDKAWGYEKQIKDAGTLTAVNGTGGWTWTLTVADVAAPGA